MEYIIKSNYYRLTKKKIEELTNNINKDNISYYDLYIDNLKDIIEECNYISLFEEQKAIIVYNSYIFSTKYEYKEELELLEKYLNNPNKNTTLIFLTDSVSLKKKCVKKIKDNNNLLELNIEEKEIDKYIKEYLKDIGFKIDNIALKTIITNLNSNYDQILNELDKVIIMKKDYIITKEDIDKYTIKDKKDNIFDFVEDIISKKTDKIYPKLNKYIKTSEEPAILFSNIATQYRLMYIVKNLMNKGYSEKKISELLDIHPYRVKLAIEKSFNYSNNELKEKLLAIGELDEKVKLGLIDKYVSLKLFLINL